MKIIEEMGGNPDIVRDKIDKIVVKTIIATLNTLSKKYKEAREEREDKDSVCF